MATSSPVAEVEYYEQLIKDQFARLDAITREQRELQQQIEEKKQGNGNSSNNHNNKKGGDCPPTASSASSASPKALARAKDADKLRAAAEACEQRRLKCLQRLHKAIGQLRCECEKVAITGVTAESAAAAMERQKRRFGLPTALTSSFSLGSKKKEKQQQAKADGDGESGFTAVTATDPAQLLAERWRWAAYAHEIDAVYAARCDGARVEASMWEESLVASALRQRMMAVLAELIPLERVLDGGKMRRGGGGGAGEAASTPIAQVVPSSSSSAFLSAPSPAVYKHSRTCSNPVACDALGATPTRTAAGDAFLLTTPPPPSPLLSSNPSVGGGGGSAAAGPSSNGGDSGGVSAEDPLVRILSGGVSDALEQLRSACRDAISMKEAAIVEARLRASAAAAAASADGPATTPSSPAAAANPPLPTHASSYFASALLPPAQQTPTTAAGNQTAAPLPSTSVGSHFHSVHASAALTPFELTAVRYMASEVVRIATCYGLALEGGIACSGVSAMAAAARGCERERERRNEHRAAAAVSSSSVSLQQRRASLHLLTGGVDLSSPLHAKSSSFGATASFGQEEDVPADGPSLSPTSSGASVHTAPAPLAVLDGDHTLNEPPDALAIPPAEGAADAAAVTKEISAPQAAGGTCVIM